MDLPELRAAFRHAFALDTIAKLQSDIRTLPSELRYKVFPRDTPRALAAMEVVYSYLQELAAEKEPDPKESLRTTSLISRQIRKAEWFDRDAILTVTDNETTLAFTIPKLKIAALEAEANARILNNQNKKAARCFERAIRIAPSDAHLRYCLGVVLTDLSDKRYAIRALKKAVKLQPSNVHYRKALDRARHISRPAKVIRETSESAISTLAVIKMLLFIGLVALIYYYILGPIYAIATAPDKPNPGLVELLVKLFAYATLCMLVIVVPFLIFRWIVGWILSAPFDAYYKLSNRLRR